MPLVADSSMLTPLEDAMPKEQGIMERLNNVLINSII